MARPEPVISAAARRLPAAGDQAPLLIWLAGPDRRLDYLNRTALAFTGLALNQGLDDWIALIHPADRAGYESTVASAFHAGRPFRAQYRLRRRDGKYRCLLQHAAPLRAGRRPVGFAGWCVDVTDFRRAEKRLHRRLSALARSGSPAHDPVTEALEIQAAQFRSITDAIPVSVARLDVHGRYQFANRAYAARFDLSPDALVGRHMADVAGAEACEVLRPYLQRALTGERVEFDATIPYRNLGPRYIHGSYAPEVDASGAVVSLVTVLTDATQRAEAERERDALLAREQSAREQAEAAAHARDQFLAVVSHELRSPLNGIQSWVYVLEQQPRSNSPTVQRALAGIRMGVEQQVRLIEDLLDATRIISGQLRLARQPLALRPVIQAALESVGAAASAKDVTLVTDIRLETEQIYGDADRLQQIVWNLLDNAVKFVPPGGTVWLGCGRDAKSAIITVRDNGRGIEPEFLPHLFDRFRQADASSTRRHDGLGLGLALVRNLTELHGGKATAESPGKGQGSTFRVELPLWKAETPVAIAPAGNGDTETPLPSLAGMRVLLVDDQQEARDSVTALLASTGAEVLTAASGREALAVLDRLGADARPDVMICDIAMPEEDGFLTLRKIRAWETQHGVPFGARMPAVALTAYALREDRIRALASGYRMHLPKPVTPQELIVVLATVAGRARAELS